MNQYNGDKCKLLIDAGTDIYHLNKKSQTALFFADYDSSKLLIEAGIDINHFDIDGRNALSHILYDIKKYNLLVEHGIDICEKDKPEADVLFVHDRKTLASLSRLRK
ncbi:ankyrin repeat domain-containing protein [Enterobacteriaceae bacterium LUAb1]